ncbi:type IIL restriction-modification enzyme MmeI [Corynebacterium choanae]|uniref:MmeI-like N-terminal domain-containing protein n=1 Tax=Corynebacterium choanae TaxID=1862358 RepID=A0A3G6JAM4_9CORY|nr:type IIL restriction-modification enzyme MmeI [Corynebacterium choanae]AZA13014.1 hypothetical protein CCHOA_02990 [Corynebacterium choanae]
MSIEYTTDKEAAALRLMDFSQLWAGRADTFDAENESTEVDRRQFFTGLLSCYNVSDEDLQTAIDEAASLNSSGLENPVDILWPAKVIGRAVEPGTDLVESLNSLLVDIPESADNPSLVVVTDFANICKLSLADDSETETFPVTELPDRVEDFFLFAEVEVEDEDDEEEE